MRAPPVAGYAAALAASVALCAVILSQQQEQVRAVRATLQDEVRWFLGLLAALRAPAPSPPPPLPLPLLPLPLLLLLLLLLCAALLAFASPSCSCVRQVRDAVSRRRARRAGRHVAARSFAHAQNAATTTAHGSLLELFVATSFRYAVEPANVVCAAVVVLQSIGSGSLSRAAPNAAMLAAFWALTLLSEALTHARRASADADVNGELFYAAPLGARVSWSAAGGFVGFSRVRAEQLGMGCIVAVEPGRRVPIEGYVLRAPTAAGADAAGAGAEDAGEATPFSYAVAGESIVADPPYRALPVPFSALTAFECKLADGDEEDAPPAPAPPSPNP